MHIEKFLRYSGITTVIRQVEENPHYPGASGLHFYAVFRRQDDDGQWREFSCYATRSTYPTPADVLEEMSELAYDYPETQTATEIWAKYRGVNLLTLEGHFRLEYLRQIHRNLRAFLGPDLYDDLIYFTHS